MKFTEREMTIAVEAVAEHLFTAQRRPWKRGSAADAWREMSRGEQYRFKAAAGDLVLPPLVALPERPTVGATPEFTDEEYAEAAEAGDTKLAPAKLKDALTRIAVAAMPIRQDPDNLIVPDHL